MHFFRDVNAGLKLLFNRQELGREPSEDIVDDRFCEGNRRVSSVPGRLETDMGKFVEAMTVFDIKHRVDFKGLVRKNNVRQDNIV